MQEFADRYAARARALDLPDASMAFAAESRLGEAIVRLASAPVSVMLIGEPGRGRRWAAAALHRRSSMPGPLLQLERVELAAAGSDPGGSDLERLLSELPGGALYIPDVSGFPACWQATLAEHAAAAAGPRLLAAIDGDPQLRIAGDELRRDLHDSLLPLPVPPLCERTCDIEPTLRVLLRAHADRHGVEPPAISDIARARLQAHDWPGDHAELEQLAERALALGSLEAAMRPLSRTAARRPSAPAVRFGGGLESGR
jgi:DNA-binding NtrC family response regulator